MPARVAFNTLQVVETANNVVLHSSHIQVNLCWVEVIVIMYVSSLSIDLPRIKCKYFDFDYCEKTQHNSISRNLNFYLA